MGETKRYNDLNTYLRNRFGRKVYKLALSSSSGCPNRDGTCGTGGCIFCSEGGSGDFAAPVSMKVADQLSWAKERLRTKLAKEYDTAGFIAYFQSYTSTYAPIERLRSMFFEAINDPSVCVLSIATRPDCLGEEVTELLTELNKIKPVWVELGLQTVHEDSAEYIRRGYRLGVFEAAVNKLSAAGIEVIVHVILGLPGETPAQMLETVRFVSELDIQGIKLQLLHVLKGTELGKQFECGEVYAKVKGHAEGEMNTTAEGHVEGEMNTTAEGHVEEEFVCSEKGRRLYITTVDEYIEILAKAVCLLPQNTVIHRLTGDAPHDKLLFPKWSANKRLSLNGIVKYMMQNDLHQGDCFRPRNTFTDSPSV